LVHEQGIDFGGVPIVGETSPLQEDGDTPGDPGGDEIDLAVFGWR
jgi:hypothetical protein